MAQNSLSTLKYEIKAKRDFVKNTETELRIIERDIFKAMDDTVGANAQKSMNSICNCFSSNMVDGLKNADNAVNTMVEGYNEANRISKQCTDLLSQAHNIVNNLGDL